MPLSYDKKGAKKFLKSRCNMYLIPMILGLFFIILPLHYFYNVNFRHNSYNFLEYAKYIFFGLRDKPQNWYDKWLTVWPDLKFAHLWFLEHLLVYSVAYTLIRKIVKKTIIISNPDTKPPTLPIILLCVALLSIVTFVVRIWYHLDFWGALLGFIQL
ncbi:hypothetical protein KPL55_13585 [Clostridium lacusfryxellense]|nr:hypothetical protein [Clostridium lacusfryxellense]